MELFLLMDRPDAENHLQCKESLLHLHNEELFQGIHKRYDFSLLITFMQHELIYNFHYEIEMTNPFSE
jgi:hypothetical protein